MLQISEEFNDKYGRLSNYDSYDLPTKELIRDLYHLDIRSFHQADLSAPGTVYQMSLLTMGGLEGLPVGSIPGNIILSPGEQWTGSPTVGIDSSLNNIYTLRKTFNGSNSFRSTLTDNSLIDLTGFADSDLISIWLPAFPNANITLSTTKVYFEDSLGEIVVVPFNATGTTLTNYAGGNYELKFALSVIKVINPDIDLTKIKIVGFDVVTTSNVTFKVSGFRAVKASWQKPPSDIDTRMGRIRLTPMPGIASSISTPTLFRSNDLPGSRDPRPIDVEISAIFNTGSKTAASNMTLYFREVAADYLTQLDLDTLTQGQLDGHDQPDIGPAMFDSRLQEDLDLYDQGGLDQEIQSDLDHIQDTLASSWVRFSLNWNSGTSVLNIGTPEAPNFYTFSAVGLVASTEYVMIIKIVDNIAEVAIYNIDTARNIGSKIFDSNQIYDDFLFKRRKGRFGWSLSFGDGDAYVDSFRERVLSYAEYRSAAFESLTPIDGSRLFVTGSSDIEKFDNEFGFVSTSPAAEVTRDNFRSTSGESYKITNLGSSSISIVSNDFSITDFKDSKIILDLFYQTDDLLIFALFSENYSRIIELISPPIVKDQWQTIRLNFPQNILTGTYKFGFIQPSISTSTWWVDKVSISSKTIAWQGRSRVDDPWISNDALWVPFHDSINEESAGISFEDRDKFIQIRGKALTPSATLSNVQFIPKYSELGRIIESEPTPIAVSNTTSYSSSISTLTVTFTDTSTVSPGYVAISEWNFGDGIKGIGNKRAHTYATSGTYTITHTIMDSLGNISTNTGTISV